VRSIIKNIIHIILADRKYKNKGLIEKANMYYMFANWR